MPNIIQVKQRKITFGDKYRISVNGQEVLKCSRGVFQMYPRLTVTAVQGGPAIFEIEQRMAVMFHAMFVFNFGQNKYELNTVSWWDRHFRIHMGQDVFEIFGHRGRKVSVFLNGKQVAWFQWGAVRFFSGDTYTIHADSRVSVDWLIAICLMWDAAFNRGYRGAIKIHIGWLFQARKFDKNWIPM
jgi:uncharacterized protein YxjI